MLVIKALDGLAMRASAIAQNVANANSPSYAPVRVDFERQLRDAASAGVDAVRSVKPRYTYAPATSGTGEMRLDLELASASETALRYVALIDVLGRQMQISRLVVAGGR